MMDRRMREELDNHITGHYGEDQFQECEGEEAPETLIEIDARFPPKKTRPLIGKLARKGRAEFKTAFADKEEEKL